MTKRRFPHNTCPASRHVEMLADQLLDSGRSAMIESEPENCAVSMHSTVEALYGARDRIEQIERVLAQAREALECATKHHTTTSLPLAIERFGTREAAQAFGMRTWRERIPNAIAAIDEAMK